MKRAILLSGGVDSSAVAFREKPQLAIVIDYGQKSAAGEERAARVISKRLNIPLEIIQIDCSSLGSGDMAGTSASPHAPVPEWWPYRNQLLVTLAAPVALKFGAQEILVGTVSTDRQHADGTPEFIKALNLLMMTQEGQIGVSAPGLARTSVELVRDSGKCQSHSWLGLILVMWRTLRADSVVVVQSAPTYSRRLDLDRSHERKRNLAWEAGVFS